MNLKPKLYYFSVRGLGQCVRFLLAYLNIEYDMIYVDSMLTEQFRDENLKFGQVPVLELDDGFKITQTNAISKYIAKQCEFIGKSAKEEALVDETLSCILSDLMVPALNAAKGLENKEKIIEIQIPRVFGAYDKILNQSKYIVGNDLSLADLYVYVAYDYYDFLGYGDIINKYSNIQRLKNYFESHNGIQAYRESRPTTYYHF